MKHAQKFAALAAALCMLTSCGKTQPEPRAQQEPAHRQQHVYARQGEDVRLPLMLRTPLTDGTLITLLSGRQLAGAFTSVTSCSTRDFTTEGSITVHIRALPEAAPSSGAKASFSLWRLAENASEYLETVWFTCDGTTQCHSFEGLDAARQYRVVFTCTDASVRRMSGTFSVDGVTAEIEEEQEESMQPAVP